MTVEELERENHLLRELIFRHEETIKSLKLDNSLMVNRITQLEMSMKKVVSDGVKQIMGLNAIGGN